MSISDHFLCHNKHTISLTDTCLFKEVIAVFFGEARDIHRRTTWAKFRVRDDEIGSK